jgi:hypothetical protein
MKLFYVIAILFCTVATTVAANQCLNQCLNQSLNKYVQSSFITVDCDELLPGAINKLKLFILVLFTSLAVNINMLRAFILICIMVTINHDIIVSMAKSYGICV